MNSLDKILHTNATCESNCLIKPPVLNVPLSLRVSKKLADSIFLCITFRMGIEPVLMPNAVNMTIIRFFSFPHRPKPSTRRKLMPMKMIVEFWGKRSIYIIFREN